MGVAPVEKNVRGLRERSKRDSSASRPVLASPFARLRINEQGKRLATPVGMTYLRGRLECLARKVDGKNKHSPQAGPARSFSFCLERTLEKIFAASPNGDASLNLVHHT